MEQFYSMFGSPATSFQDQLFRDLQKFSDDNIEVIYVIFGNKGDCPKLYEVVKNRPNHDDILGCKLRDEEPYPRIQSTINNHDYVMGYVYAAPKRMEVELDSEFIMIAFSGLRVEKYYMNDLKRKNIEALVNA